MKIVDLSRFAKRTISFALLLTLFTAYSMVTLATSTKPVGELIVLGGSSDGASVTVNGEPATSGRTIFASSTIITPDGVTAVLNMGKSGKIELSPNTTFVIDGDGNVIGGSLTAGNVTVLNTAEPIGIKTLSGETISLISGETAAANSATPAKRAKPGPGGLDWWVWGAIIGGAVATAVIIYVATNDDNPTTPIR
jgi:hypothetical protein